MEAEEEERRDEEDDRAKMSPWFLGRNSIGIVGEDGEREVR